jgi:hypothetical protein
MCMSKDVLDALTKLVHFSLRKQKFL